MFGKEQNGVSIEEARLKFLVEDNATKKITQIESAVSALSLKVTGLSFGFQGLNGALKFATKQYNNFFKATARSPKLLDSVTKGIGAIDAAIVKLNIALLGAKAFLTSRDTLKKINLEIQGVNRSLAVLDSSLGGLDKFKNINSFKNTFSLTKLFNKEGQQSLVNSIKAYNDFNEALSRVNTVIKLGQKDLDSYGKRIQNLVSDDLKNAVSSTQALAGAYEVASGGFTDTAENSAVLTAGLKLSTSAQSDSGATLRLLVQTLKAYDLSATRAAEVAGKLNGIVENGITTISELNLGFGQTAAVARQAGISIDDLGASISLLTSKGTSTPIALTQIQSLSKVISSGQLQQNLDSLNATLNGARVKINAATVAAIGLPAALKNVSDALAGNQEKLQAAIGDFNAYKAALTLLSNETNDLASISNKIAAAGAKSLNEVFGIRLNNSQFQKFIAILNRVGEIIIRIGRIAQPFFDRGTKALAKILVKVEKFVAANQGLIENAIKASLAWNSFKAVLELVIKQALNLLLIYGSIRLLNGQLFNDIGNLFKATKKLGEGAGIWEIVENRIKNNTIATANNRSILQKLGIVLRNLTGIRAVENLQLDNANNVIKENNKGLFRQIFGNSKLGKTKGRLIAAYNSEIAALARSRTARQGEIVTANAATVANNNLAASTARVGIAGKLTAGVKSLGVFLPQITAGFAGLKTAAVTSLNTAAVGVKNLTGAIVGLTATLAPLLLIGAAFATFTFFNNIKSQADRLNNSIADTNRQIIATRTQTETIAEIAKTEIKAVKASSDRLVVTFKDIAGATLNWIASLPAAVVELSKMAALAEPLTNLVTTISVIGDETVRSIVATKNLRASLTDSKDANELLYKGISLTKEELEKLNRASSSKLKLARDELRQSQGNLELSKKELANLKRQRDQQLANDKNARKKDSFKRLEDSIKLLEETIEKNSARLEVEKKAIETQNELIKQRAILTDRLNDSIGNQGSILANKLTNAYKQNNKELEANLNKIQLISNLSEQLVSDEEKKAILEDDSLSDKEKRLAIEKKRLAAIKGLSVNIDKNTQSALDNLQKQLDSGFIGAKDARKKIEDLLNKPVKLNDSETTVFEKLLSPEQLQKLKDFRIDLIEEESNDLKTIYDRQEQYYRTLQKGKVIDAIESSQKILELQLKSDRAELRSISARLDRQGIAEEEKQKLAFKRASLQQQIFNSTSELELSNLNDSLKREQEYNELKLKALREYQNSSLTASIENSERIAEIQIKNAKNTVRQLNNQFQQLKLKPDISKQELLKARQEILNAQAKFEILQVKAIEQQTGDRFKKIINQYDRELLQLKIIQDGSIASQEKIAKKSIEIEQQKNIRERKLLKQRIDLARQFGGDTFDLEKQLLEKQLEFTKLTTEQIAVQFDRTASKINSIADRYSSSLAIETSKQQSLTSAFNLQIDALKQRSKLSDLFGNSQEKSLQAALRLNKSKTFQRKVQQELLNLERAKLNRSLNIEQKILDLKQKQKDSELELLEIKLKAEEAKKKAELASAIAEDKRIQLSKTATAEEKAASKFKIEAAKEALKATAVEQSLLAQRKALRRNEKKIEKQILNEKFQQRRDRIEEREVELTPSKRDDVKLANRRLERAKNTKTPEFTNSTPKPGSIYIDFGNGKVVDRKYNISPSKNQFEKVEVPQQKQEYSKEQLSSIYAELPGGKVIARTFGPLAKFKQNISPDLDRLSSNAVNSIAKLEKEFDRVKTSTQDTQKSAIDKIKNNSTATSTTSIKKLNADNLKIFGGRLANSSLELDKFTSTVQTATEKLNLQSLTPKSNFLDRSPTRGKNRSLTDLLGKKLPVKNDSIQLNIEDITERIKQFFQLPTVTLENSKLNDKVVEAATVKPQNQTINANPSITIIYQGDSSKGGDFNGNQVGDIVYDKFTEVIDAVLDRQQ